ncbi:uncharacterized protein ACRADG_005794 [Cochliomyia hominivorax]
MKFVFAVVLLAFAVGVQSSLLGVGPLGLPLGLGHWGHAAVDHSAWAGPLVAPLAGHGFYGGIPGISLAQGPALGHHGLGLAHGAGLGLAHGAGLALAHGAHAGPGVYVAKTRGAVHTAPLAGHLASATSVNVAPAPGTH